MILILVQIYIYNALKEYKMYSKHTYKMC